MNKYILFVRDTNWIHKHLVSMRLPSPQGI